MILQDTKKQRGEMESETDNRETETRVILHGREWSGFVRVTDMVIFQELCCIAKFRGK